MFRLLSSHQINVSYHEIPAKEHWWWDTVKPNDGGVLNDLKMRKFFASCFDKSNADWNYKYSNSAVLTDESSDQCREMNDSDTLSIEENGIKLNPRVNHYDKLRARNREMLKEKSLRCHNNFTYSVINPAMQQLGFCGLIVRQQHVILSKSEIIVTFKQRNIIDIHNRYRLNEPSVLEVDMKRQSNNSDDYLHNRMLYEDMLIEHIVCELTTRNVYRFSLNRRDTSSSLYLCEYLFVNGEHIVGTDVGPSVNTNQALSNTSMDIDDQSISIDVCVSSSTSTSISLTEVCRNKINIIEEKTFVNYGPVRLIYARPIYIVYGTPNDSNLRTILRDYALYLANNLMLSHDTYVKVVSDIEYKTSKYYLDNVLSNLIMIGGPRDNKVMNKLCYDGSMYDSSRSNIMHSNQMKPLLCNSPVTFHNDDIHRVFDKSKSEDAISFQIGLHNFTSDHSLMFTFPVVRLNNQDTTDEISNDISMCLCIHASSVKNYLHLSRIAWPVIPPMVRSSFANYLPDYIVLNHEIWSKGFGGVIMAGFWNISWQFDPHQSFRLFN